MPFHADRNARSSCVDGLFWAIEGREGTKLSILSLFLLSLSYPTHFNVSL